MALAPVLKRAGPPLDGPGSSYSRALRRRSRLPRGRPYVGHWGPRPGRVSHWQSGTARAVQLPAPHAGPPGATAVPLAESHVQRARADARAVARLIHRATAAQPEARRARDSGTASATATAARVGPDRTRLVLLFNARRIWRPPACRNRVANVAKTSAWQGLLSRKFLMYCMMCMHIMMLRCRDHSNWQLPCAVRPVRT